MAQSNSADKAEKAAEKAAAQPAPGAVVGAPMNLASPFPATLPTREVWDVQRGAWVPVTE